MKSPDAMPFNDAGFKNAEKLNSRLNSTFSLTGFNEIPKDQRSTLKKNYSARLNTLRLVAIASIVWGHTLFGWESKVFTSPVENFTQLVFIQFGRVGTIIFFIISGFFFAEKSNCLSITGYLKYRLRGLILPWAFFVILCVMLQLFQVYSINKATISSPGNFLIVTRNLLSAAIFHAAYWFIPVSIISACCLIAAKRVINKAWFGFLLIAITLFYQVNLYYGWIPAIHTKSVLGYVMFMWIGVLLKNNIGRVHSWIKYVTWPALITGIVVAFTISCSEGLYLKKIGCSDPFASIRFSNAVLSILVFAAFIKVRTLYRIKKMQPQKYVYGVYLIHSLILLELAPIIDRFISRYNVFDNLPLMVVLQIFMFAVVLTASYLVAMLLKNSRLHFLVGR